MKNKIKLSILLLFCSAFVVNTQASLVLKVVGSTIRATGNLLIAGTLVAVGQAQEKLETHNNLEKLSAHNIVEQWKSLLQNGKKGVTTLHELATAKLDTFKKPISISEATHSEENHDSQEKRSEEDNY